MRSPFAVVGMADGRFIEGGAPAELLTNRFGELAALYRDAHGLSVHAESAD
jgi:hypothetical protein